MKSPSKRLIATGSIILLWLGAMGWLILSEAYPGLRDRASLGYRTFLDRGIMVMDRWMIITHQNQTIGYTHTSVDVDEKNATRQYRLNNRTLLSLTVMGSRQRISVTSDATVDALYNLQLFHFSLSSAGYTIVVDGKRLEGNTFDVKIKSASSIQHLTVIIPDDAVIYSPMTEMSLKSLLPGRQVTLRIFNPVTLAAQNVTVRALRRETLILRNRTNETTVLAAKMDGMETLSWMDAEGTMIRQQTPFGWAMESCTAEEALTPANPKSDTGDLLASLAVPIRGDTSRLTTQPAVKLRLTGTTLTREQLTTHRQEVVALGTNFAEIIVKADTLPKLGTAETALPPGMEPWLASTAFIQSSDPRLISKAREIIGTRSNRLDAATALYNWVYTHVAKQSTISLPSALDVLLRPEGDCNEHTYLFVGLARAAGLPARIRVGLTLHEGRFYYHAWPSVYAGQWLDMDPTRGLPAVNAGYISLVEGELEEQMKLMSVIGQLKVEIP
jgi:hypothetical protein